MKGDFVFAVPGDLDTPTGGYAYDRRMIAELRELGWRPQVLDLGEGFPHPVRAHARGGEGASRRRAEGPADRDRRSGVRCAA